jgi:uncharacterized protein (DUF885 family)
VTSARQRCRNLRRIGARVEAQISTRRATGRSIEVSRFRARAAIGGRPRGPTRALVLAAGVALAALAAASTRAAPMHAHEPATASGAGAREVAALAEEYWQHLVWLEPVMATYLGDHRYDERLPDLGPLGRAQRRARWTSLRERLRRVDAGRLSATDRVTLRVLDTTLELALGDLDHRLYQVAVDQLGGPQINLLEIANFHPADSRRGLETLERRLRAVPRYLRQYEQNLRDGLLAGRSAPRVTVNRVVEQLQRIAVTPASKGAYRDVLGRAPPDMRARLEDALAGSLQPALGRLRQFLAEEYLPRSRTTVGIAAIPGGREAYAFLIRKHTTAALAPARIHAIGLEELGAIQQEIARIAARRGHRGELRRFIESLRTDPRNLPRSREHILEVYRAALVRATAVLPRAFGRLPRTSCIVKPIEDYREKESPAAYYYPAPEDRSRSAIYYANTYDPPSRPLHNAMALTVHEAVPGHHLQIALAQEMAGLPHFRREADFTVFVEGWALYSERLADELSLYEDELARAGMLTYQAWRACRLVVDTGLHAMGWSRDQAIEYMKKNLALSEREIVAEVERYITWPGQALAYMIGKREIVRLRAEAEAALGARFDLRGFHDTVLSSGAVPLPVLADEVRAWVARVRVPRAVPVAR